MAHVSRLIEAAQAGDRRAAAELMPLVYDELRKLASARMSAEPPGHGLNPTDLVHEAFLRLAGDQQFEGRGHFFAAAAEAMRRILIDQFRARQADKRGSARGRVNLDPVLLPATGYDADRWIDLDDALTLFESIDHDAAELTKLRVFGGLSVEEAGDALGMSRATAFRTWSYARAWLSSRLAENDGRKKTDS